MPSKGNPVLSVRLTPDLRAGLDQLAEKSNMNPANFVRSLVELAVETAAEPPDTPEPSGPITVARSAHKAPPRSITEARSRLIAPRRHHPSCTCGVCRPTKEK
jgi:hypothetical protein